MPKKSPTVLPAIYDPNSLEEKLGKLLIGQPEAIEAIVPHIEAQQAGLNPEGRPTGVLLLLGPTGSGKTRTVEALAEVLHGSAKNLLRVDCGEFQNDHETAKLIGAPPGYLGHRETQPMLSQQKINAAASEKCTMTLLLFDEIEKAAPSMNRLLLGILDKATMRLGDNTSVNFENCLIFMTSNLGSRELTKFIKPDFGFEALLPGQEFDEAKLRKVGMASVKRRFSPEFVNRIDSVVTYRPLDRFHCTLILGQILSGYQRLVINRLGMRSFTIRCTEAAKEQLLDLGVSPEYGARELRRMVERHLMRPVAAMVARGLVPPQGLVILEARGDEFQVLVRG